MKISLFKNNNFFFFFFFLIILLGTFNACIKKNNIVKECEECKECEEIVPRDIVINEGDNTYNYGASAIINGEYWEANWATLHRENDGEYWIQIRQNVWLENVLWAFYRQIRLHNINVARTDTIMLEFMPGPFPRAFFDTGVHDATTECYELLELENFPSWILITEINEGEIAGVLQAAFTISDSCPSGPDDVQEIYITDCYFRAKLL